MGATEEDGSPYRDARGSRGGDEIREGGEPMLGGGVNVGRRGENAGGDAGGHKQVNNAHILKKVVEVKVDISNVMNRLDDLEEKMDRALEALVPHPNAPRGPTVLQATTMAEFDVQEEQLKNSANSQQLEDKLILIGGKDTRTCVANMANACMAHELQLLFNWSGRKGHGNSGDTPRRGFESTRLCRVIANAVPKCGFPGPKSLSEAKEHLKRFIRGAVDRNGGRNKRKPTNDPAGLDA